MPTHDRPEWIGNAGRPAAQTPYSGAPIASLQPQPMHAVSLLVAEHREAEALFGSIREATDPGLRADLVARLLRAIERHMIVEERVFYPVVERACELGHDIDHAKREHAGIRDRIDRLVRSADDRLAFDEALNTLERAVAHHAEEEERELFPKLDAADVDWTQVGVALVELRERLRLGA